MYSTLTECVQGENNFVYIFYPEQKSLFSMLLRAPILSFFEHKKDPMREVRRAIVSGARSERLGCETGLKVFPGGKNFWRCEHAKSEEYLA